MAEWEIDFKVPVEVDGEGYIILRGYTPATDLDAETPTQAEIASAMADAKEGFKASEWQGSVGTPGGSVGGLGEYEIDTIRPKWDKMERIPD